MLTIIVNVGTHAKHVNIVGQDAFSREVHGLRFRVAVLDVRL